MLSEEQVNYFQTFGFLVLPHLFSADEIVDISRHFDDVLSRDREGAEFDGGRRQGVLGVVEQDERLYRLLEDDRIYDAIEQLLGPGFVWIGSDGNLYVGDTGWHPDNPGWDGRRIKIALYLDPVKKESGCLRVIPGSHLPGGLGQRLRQGPRPASEAASSPYGVDGSEIPCVALESEPGDVVVFDQGLFHASFGGKTGRRMFTLNFITKPEDEIDLERLRHMYERNLELIGELGRSNRDSLYTSSFLETESPRIQAMIAAVLALGLT
jgi:ectoine hydroxylase-related dioxygenase (phytanoyl-CoA dioxygenase family)